MVPSTASLEVRNATVNVRFPDPVLSANIYCSGRLCEVIQRLVKPFWDAWRRSDPKQTTYVWVMRYARCGEHLKIRVHAPHSHTALLRKLLDSAQRQYFSYLGPPDPESPSRSTRTAPPIDREDEATADYPDRTFLWTQYNRSPLCLGYQPLIRNDQYTARITRCLGCGTEILIDRLETDSNGHSKYLSQLSLLLQALIAGISTLDLNPLERNLYLLYHRDCLLRYLRRRNIFSGEMMKIVSRFETEISNPNRWNALTKAALDSLHSNDADNWSREVSAWRSTISELIEYATPLCRSSHLDPFAELPVFPVLFKVFHGFANQIGLDQLNEAFLYHFLLSIIAEDGVRRRPVPLRPIG